MKTAIVMAAAATQGEGIALPPDRRLAAQLAAPIWKLLGNAILIESKDEIRKRLGTSTDDADAVVLAWHKREDAARAGRRERGGSIRRLGSAAGEAGTDGWGLRARWNWQVRANGV